MSPPPPSDHRFTLLIAGVWLAFSVAFGMHAWQSSHDDQVQQLRTVAELSEKAADRYFVQLQRALADLTDDIVERGQLQNLAAVQSRLARFKDRNPELVAVSLLSVRGDFLATSTTTRLTGLPSVANQRDFAAIVEKQQRDQPMELAPALLGPASGRWVLPIRYAVRGADEQVIGFIIASAPVEMLHAFWSQAPAVAKAAIALMRDDGYLINRFPVPADLDPAALYGQPRTGSLYQELKAAGFPAAGFLQGNTSLTGQAIGTVYVRLEHYPVTLLASLPQEEFVRAWWERVWAALVLAAIFAASSAFAARMLLRGQWRWSQERLDIERELRASQEFLERAGEVAGVGGWALDLRTNELTWSTHTRRIHEVDAHFVPTVDTALQFYTPEVRATMGSAVQAGIERGEPWDLELPIITAQGRSAWVRAQGRAEQRDGKVVRLVGAFQDVTEYRQRRIALQQQTALREQAEQHARELDRLLSERSQMLDVLAHEVRQPLNNASAALQGAHAALDQRTAEAAGGSLSRAQGVLDDVLQRIDNTLAVAELVASPRSLRREDTDIDFAVGLALQDLSPEQLARVSVVRETPTRTAEMDPSLVRLALRNLLVNALRYSPPDCEVTLRIIDQDDPLAVVFAVSDRGPGFERELLQHIFERGRRGKQGASQPGHGLGLYIVKRVAELHGGRVEAANDSEGGAVVRLTLPQGEQD